MAVGKRCYFADHRCNEDAVGALNVRLTAEGIAYLEECYVPHPIVGAIDKNPAQGVMLLNEKK